MREFIAIPMADGGLTWQSPLGPGVPDEKQEGVGIHFSGTSTDRETALRRLAVLLVDLEERWLRPIGDPTDAWAIDLSSLKSRFPTLSEQMWMDGERQVKPTFDVRESTLHGKVMSSGTVSFVLGRTDPVAEEQTGSVWKRLWKRLVDSSELKPSWLGLGIDLKKLFGSRRRRR